MMRPEVREALDALDRMLSSDDTEAAGQLWDVLSALRGPDMPTQRRYKSTSTVPVRRAALPLTTARYDAVMNGRSASTHLGAGNRAAFGHGEEPPVFVVQDCEVFESSHFGQHVEAAARVLGLL